jgi:hypothetical protein
VTAGTWRLELRNAPAVNGVSTTAQANEIALDAQNRLKSIGLCPSVGCLSVGTASYAEAGSDNFVSWGRWTNGTAKLTFLGVSAPIALSANQGLHYLVGTPVVSLPTAGTFSYDLLGATRPTERSGAFTPGSFSGQAVVQFGPGQAAKVGLSAAITINGSSYGFATHGGLSQPQQSQLSINTNHGFNGTINQALPGSTCQVGNHCSVQVTGGLFGAQGERLGLGYTLSSGSSATKVDGVAVFKR